MPLDIYIIGSGYGEMTLLRWEEKGVQKSALVDCYASSRNIAPLLKWFTDMGVSDFEFIALTHPHLDHISQVAQVMDAYCGKIKTIWVWPGLDARFWIAYFNKLAQKFPTSSNQLGKRAKEISNFYIEWKHQFYDLELGKPSLDFLIQLTRIYPIQGPKEDLTITCIAPWDDPMTKFVDIVRSGIQPKVKVSDIHREANLVSAGFLIEFGKTQVLLCGDMETENWLPLIQNNSNPISNPKVVKVSHHGSSTGVVGGMWGASGFLGKSCKIAVITPWNKALPDPAVIKEIQSSGCELYITGQSQLAKDNLSKVHIRIYEDDSQPKLVTFSKSVKVIKG